MSAARLPAHLFVAGLCRATQAAGGFATVVSRGEKDAGVVLVLTMQQGDNAALWERMPRLDGGRPFTVTRKEEPDKKEEFSEYIKRRIAQDPDCWLIELDVPNPEQLIRSLPD